MCKKVCAFWSVILVDLPDYRIVPNPLNRFNFNSYSDLRSGAAQLLCRPGGYFSKKDEIEIATSFLTLAYRLTCG